MPRACLIPIILAIAALPAGAALMVAPEYLHLTGAAIPLTFWGGIGLTVLLILSAAGLALKGEAQSRHEPLRMAMADSSFWLAIGAAIIAALMAIWGNKKAAIVVALIACLAVIFDFVDRRWLTHPEPLETSLSSENARLDAIKWQPIINDQKQYFTNIFLGNNGKSTVRQWGFSGTAAHGVADPDLIDALFIVFKTKMRAAKPSMSEINPGQSDTFISIPNVAPLLQLDDTLITNYRNGAVAIYTFLLLRYKDDTLQAGKFIYGEKCIYVVKDIVHFCDNGHNRNYISVD
jgi:hypothetical protein